MNNRAWLLGGLGVVWVSLYFWIFAFYPILGHDLAMVVPALWELKDAWSTHGMIDIDFSPFRCLGLPHFSNPNSFLFSLFHFLGLALREVNAVFVVLIIVATFGFLGAVKLFEDVGLKRKLSVVLAVGWCLQGFCLTHTLAGHVNYYQFALLPMLLWILLQRRMKWWMGLSFAFWMAHLLYTSGYYIILIGVPSLVAAVAALEYLLPERFRGESDWGGLRTALLNLVVKIGPWTLLLTIPKILGVFNFTAQFPREMSLDSIGTWEAFVYTLANYVWPFPYDVHGFTGWWYGNWESYEFIFPTLIVWMAITVLPKAKKVEWRRFGIVAGLLLVAGTLLSSGLLSPVFHVLPLFKSLHVNPRWNSFVFMPFACWCAVLLIRCGIRDFSPKTALIFGAIFAGTPFLYFNQQNMQISYPDRGGIDFGQSRLSYCYEPIFGYGLEAFPLGRQVNWFSENLVDARCYLKSYGCKPGTFFGQEGRPLEDQEKLRRYSLQDDYGPVKNFKKISLLFYFAAFAASLVWLLLTARALWRSNG